MEDKARKKINVVYLFEGGPAVYQGVAPNYNNYQQNPRLHNLYQQQYVPKSINTWPYNYRPGGINYPYGHNTRPNLPSGYNQNRMPMYALNPIYLPQQNTNFGGRQNRPLVQNFGGPQIQPRVGNMRFQPPGMNANMLRPGPSMQPKRPQQVARPPPSDEEDSEVGIYVHCILLIFPTKYWGVGCPFKGHRPY